MLIKELFKPLLPADVGVTSGQIIACKSGKISREQDIIIFDGSILPAMSFDSSIAIIPIESVLYTIEIKSTISRNELLAAHISAKELYDFDYLPGRSYVGGQEILHGVAKLNSTIFALSSDLTATDHGEIRRYKDIYSKDQLYLKAICVAGVGYWYEDSGSWIKFGGRKEGDDVLAFIGGVMNSYNQLSKTRGVQRIGEYLISKEPNMRSFPSGTTPTINVQCDACDQKAVVSFLQPTTTPQYWLDGFVGPQPCSACGGRLVAPAGTYHLHDGLFVQT